MCHQSVGLIQGAIEREGISTVSVTVCREITERVAPPRALELPFPFGYPLGRPHDVDLQIRAILAGLELLAAEGPPPVLRRWSGWEGG